MKNILIPSTRVLREAILGFVMQSLQPYADEKNLTVAGIQFYVLCGNAQEEEAARAVLYLDKPGLFKTEHLERSLANQFIQMEPSWLFEAHIVKEVLPANSIQKDNFGLIITRTGEPIAAVITKASLQVLAGEADQNEYILDPAKQTRFYIGRGKTPQLSSGKIQQNDIDFSNTANVHVSRNHAYIVYEPKTAHYILYPDKGGLPDNGNRLKVHTSDDKIKWLNIYGVGHLLSDGDQVELGGEAVLRFRIG